MFSMGQIKTNSSYVAKIVLDLNNKRANAKALVVLRSDKSTGADKISARLVKSAFPAIRESVTVLIINNVHFNYHSLA